MGAHHPVRTPAQELEHARYLAQEYQTDAYLATVRAELAEEQAKRTEALLAEAERRHAETWELIEAVVNDVRPGEPLIWYEDGGSRISTAPSVERTPFRTVVSWDALIKARHARKFGALPPGDQP